MLALPLWSQPEAHHFLLCFVRLGLELWEIHLPDPLTSQFLGFWQEGDTGGRLTCRSKGEKGLGCFQLLSAFLLWPAIALVRNFFRNFWHPFAVVPARFQVSVILCVSCSPHPASFIFDCIDYFWLCWVFAASRGLSLVAVWASRCRGFSLYRAQPLEWGLR